MLGTVVPCSGLAACLSVRTGFLFLPLSNLCPLLSERLGEGSKGAVGDIPRVTDGT